MVATILVAEDDAQIRRVCTIWLTQKGHTVLEACDGQQAKEIMESKHIDLLISDVHMPTLDGTDLVAWWREEKESQQPVMMFSASCEQRVLEARMENYDVTLFPKPFSPPQLVKTVDNLLLGMDQ